MNKKRSAIIVAVVLFLVGAALAWWYVASRNQDKKCVAPNDDLLSCDALRQNPTKTDWINGN